MAHKADSTSSKKAGPSQQRALPASTAASTAQQDVPHHLTLTTGAYLSVMMPILGTYLTELGVHLSAPDFVREFLDGVKPRDPMEELLAVQALMTHIRVLNLTVRAGNATSLPVIESFNEYADRASNTFRRLMLALHEYRKPPRTPDSFTAIKQANIAQQQVVQNGKSQNETATNEQGCPPSPAPAAQLPEHGPAVLPAESEGLGLTEVIGQPRATVDAVHRSPNP